MMKRQELDQLRQKTKEDLLKELATAQREVVKMRLEGQRSTQNVHALRSLRKKVAQLASLVQEKEIV